MLVRIAQRQLVIIFFRSFHFWCCILIHVFPIPDTINSLYYSVRFLDGYREGHNRYLPQPPPPPPPPPPLHLQPPPPPIFSSFLTEIGRDTTGIPLNPPPPLPYVGYIISIDPYQLFSTCTFKGIGCCLHFMDSYFFPE